MHAIQVKLNCLNAMKVGYVYSASQPYLNPSTTVEYFITVHYYSLAKLAYLS